MAGIRLQGKAHGHETRTGLPRVDQKMDFQLGTVQKEVFGNPFRLTLQDYDGKVWNESRSRADFGGDRDRKNLQWREDICFGRDRLYMSPAFGWQGHHRKGFLHAEAGGKTNEVTTMT